MSETVVIVGGGAGGMTTAAILKKTCPEKRVVVFEKSEYVSWAGCPTPYYISDELPFEAVVRHGVEDFIKRGIEVYNHHEVEKIDFDKKNILVKGGKINGLFEYDKLVLSLGGNPFIPNINGFSDDIKGIFRLSHIDHAIKIKEYIQKEKPKKACIIGGGFIGLEMAESFHLRGIDLTLVEKLDALFPKINQGLLKPVYDKFDGESLKLITGKSVVGINSQDGVLKSIVLDSGEKIETDILLISIGLRPNTQLLEKSSFEFNEKGRVYVDRKMRTYIEDVYAIGDMIFTENTLTGQKVYAPFGDAADKQGLVVGKNLCGQEREFKGVMGTFATSFFDIKISKTGLSLEEAVEAGYNAKSVYVTAVNEVPLFKNAGSAKTEVIYDFDDKIILGATMVGDIPVAQFIDQFAIAISKKLNFESLFDVDYAYSPTNSIVWNPILAAYRKIIK